MLLTRWLLRHDHYTAAARVYIGACLIALTGALIISAPGITVLLGFFFALLIFLVGLLLPPSNTILFAVVSALIVAIAPGVAQGTGIAVGMGQAAAMLLTFLSAFIAIQVTGDLYQIAQWALLNYQRERRVAGELFESRIELERSLARTQALSERLQETNQELNSARAAAEEAKHFRGQFLANMSHELRTPLNAIIGFSETMLRFPAMYDAVKLPNAYEADLQQIYASGRQLLTLINDILDLAKVDAGKLDIRMGRVELKPLFTSVLSTAHGLLAGKPIQLELDFADALPEVWADEARVRQVLLNLYSNAAKFTECGSIRLSARATDDGVQVTLSDTGIGIAQQHLEIIFEEFKQAESLGRDPRSGAGLGLAISRQLLTLMGGRIWAESELGKGSSFHFFLRRYEGVAEVKAENSGKGTAAAVREVVFVKSEGSVRAL
jgi:signal transduction histidine kinase